MANEHPDRKTMSGRELLPLPETLPPPTVWPVTLALGITLVCFGVVTSWVMSLAGLIFSVLGIGGWIKELRNDVQ